MKIALIVISVIIALAVIIFIVKEIKYKLDLKFIVDKFQNGNCIVFGKKGKGKDLLFNAVINKRNVLAYSNIQYNKDLINIKPIKDFSVEPNTYLNMLNGNIEFIPKKIKENTDFYISDGGIYLPSQYSQQLIKLYPSLPIFYATSRHLGNMNIHINTQYLGRIWDKLREQADSYFKCVETVRHGNNLITTIIYYDTYKSAMAELLPFKQDLFNSSEVKASYKDFEAKNGTVKQLKIKQKIKNVNYDTRYFHKVFYNKRAPNTIN